MNVLGLDLSLTATGIALPGGHTYTVGGPAGRGDHRLLDIVTALHSSLRDRPDLAVLEDLPTHAKGAGITGMVHGAVRLYLVQEGIPYALVTAATLKAYATGNGSADKHAMRMAAYKRAGREFGDDNQADAWWLRAAGLDHYGTAEHVLPAAQRARLKKVIWPDLTPPLGGHRP